MGQTLFSVLPFLTGYSILRSPLSKCDLVLFCTVSVTAKSSQQSNLGSFPFLVKDLQLPDNHGAFFSTPETKMQD